MEWDTEPEHHGLSSPDLDQKGLSPGETQVARSMKAHSEKAVAD